MSKSMIHPLRTAFAQLQAQKRLWSAVFWNAAFLLLIPAVQAQTTSSIAGTIRDAAGALVPGAKVTLINEASKATRATTSNGEGYFTFVAVQPATYSVQVKMTNFETWKVTGIEVHPGDSLTVPRINLTIGKVVESVVVTAEMAGVTQNSGEHSTLITSADIARLSTTGRDALELVSTLPGFTLNAGTGLNNSAADYTTTSFGSGQLGSFGANGAAPQQGLVNITSDGAQVIDPGDMSGTLANINMDQVQEVNVQTSNFGADEAKGPIVINAVGKSGGTAYHGSLYSYARNHIFNSNDWLSNNQTPVVAKAPSKYFYPGGTIGGPVKIPGTHFNESKHLTFWAGFEYYDQLTNTNGSFSGPQYAFIPTPRMMGTDPTAPSPGIYDFSWDALAKALNTPVGPPTPNPNNFVGIEAGCAADYNVDAHYSNIGGDCHSPSGADQNGVPISSGILNSVNPAMATFTKLYPAINRVPQTAGGYASDGYNWAKNVMASNNGFQFHGRVDQNFSESLKLYGTYNWEKVNTQQPLNNVYYNPPGTVPFPTPLDTYGNSSSASLNLTKVLNSSMTNELTAAGLYFDQPEQFQDRSLALDTGTPWAANGYEGGPLRNGTNQLPRINSYETIGIPNFSFGYVPPGSQFLRKSFWNISDNLTKVYHTHTVKAGIYLEQTRNNSVTLGSDANGNITFARWDTCYPNQQTATIDQSGNYSGPPTTSLGNTAANFLAGCPQSFSQSNKDPNVDMYFNTLEFYATDEWKVNSKLTLTFGMRLSHLPPWEDSHGIGAAVWDPTKYNPILPNVFDPNMTLNSSTWPGITWHKLTPSVPVAGVGSRPLFYSPRVGVAYDLRGDGKTVFRGGWGAYRSRDSYNIAANAVTTGINLVDQGVYGSYGCTLDQLMNASSTPTGTQVLPCGNYSNGTLGFSNANNTTLGTGVAPSVAADDPHDNEQPITYNYNLTVDRQLPFGSTLEVAYVGNQSSNLATLGNTSNSLYSLQNQNVIPLGAFFGPDPQIGGGAPTGETIPAVTIAAKSATENQYRPYPNYAGVLVPHHTNWANYNALQVSLNKQRGSLVIGANYTWSKALGVRGNYDTGNTADPVNAHHDYGIVSFDRPQALNFTYSYQEGAKFHGKRQLGWLLNFWELSGITKFASGPDLSILNGNTNYNLSVSTSYFTSPSQSLSSLVGVNAGAPEWLGSSDYLLQPSITCDPRKGLHSALLSGTEVSKQYVNGKCFALPAQGRQGTWTLPDVHGPAFFSSDLSIYKDVQMTDRQQLQFRMSGFNFLNHPIPSFNNANLAALNLTFTDAKCNTSTGAGCLYPESAALGALSLQNTGFGYTNYKFGVRIVEFGVKYNF